MQPASPPPAPRPERQAPAAGNEAGDSDAVPQSSLPEPPNSSVEPDSAEAGPTAPDGSNALPQSNRPPIAPAQQDRPSADPAEPDPSDSSPAAPAPNDSNALPQSNPPPTAPDQPSTSSAHPAESDPADPTPAPDDSNALPQSDRPPTTPVQPDTPSAEPADATPTPTEPLWQARSESLPSFIGCLAALTVMGADVRRAEPLTDPEIDPDCGILRPVRLGQIRPGLSVEGEPLLRCETALALALWTHQVVAPAAAQLDGAPRPAGLLTGPGYACRPRAGTDRLSEHALGNAVDIAGIRLSDGQVLMIEPRENDPLGRFQSDIHAGACQFFTTVLGPGSDAAHDDHLHLDVIRRANDWRICQ
ncbi:MAG: extensin family protein [Paracoccus sp. (in: a-proteobacteria)]|nr:extensin family protein [Paracoccus sp. (in: a-proteobacteria)]